MPEIRDRKGNVIQRSRNLAGIRGYIGRNLVRVMSLDPIKGPLGWGGKLLILFDNGASYETNFASFSVLCGFVRRWRNAQGAPLRIAGVDANEVSLRNPFLVMAERIGK